MTPRPRPVAVSVILLALAGCAHPAGHSGAAGRAVFSSLPPLGGFTGIDARTWTNDEGLVQRLELLDRPADGRRIYLYRGHISVCGTLDGQCKPHRFDLAFDETGGCLGLRVRADWPFTKAAHDPFVAADYRQLDAILRDEAHPLGDLPPPRQRAQVVAEGNVGIDGVSGATLSYYSDHAVAKAFYTTHAVWYAAHRQLPPIVQRWTLERVRAADVRAWAARGDALGVWWLLDHLEASAIPRAEAVDLAYGLLGAPDARIAPPALRYLRRTAAPFRPAPAVGARYAALSGEARRELLEWWGGAGYGSDELDAALRAELAAGADSGSATAAAILRYLEQTGRVARDPAGWRPALEAFAAGTPSTFLRGKAQRLLGAP
jgi:hypothetical protein